MKSWHYSNSWTLLSKDIHINLKMILGNAQADMNMLGWYINMLGWYKDMFGWYMNMLDLVVLVFAIRSSRLCWLASAMIKRRWSSNITSGKLNLRFASCYCQSCSCKLFDSKDVSYRWKTSKYEYTQCQQILEHPCSSDWIFTAGLKTDLIFITDITDYIRGEKSVMWRNFRFL